MHRQRKSCVNEKAGQAFSMLPVMIFTVMMNNSLPAV